MAEDGFDAVVVLGAALDDQGNLTPALAKRMATGIEAIQKGEAPLLIVSGGKTGAVRAEAEAMAEIALSAGFSKEVVILEPRSLNTWQNAAFVREIANVRGLNKLLVISDAVHLPRAGAIFRLHHFRVALRPAKGRFGNPIWELGAWVKFVVCTARDFVTGRLP